MIPPSSVVGSFAVGVKTLKVGFERIVFRLGFLDIFSLYWLMPIITGFIRECKRKSEIM
jgi:hypothetical protein